MLAKKSKKIKSKKKQSIFVKIFWVASFSFLFIYLSYANVKIFLTRSQFSSNLKQLNVTAESLEKQQNKLNAELGVTGTEAYVEQVAREELGYKKEGEQVVVIKKEESKSIQEAKQANGLQFFENILNWFRDRLGGAE
jgi:cell division protein FtsB